MVGAIIYSEYSERRKKYTSREFKDHLCIEIESFMDSEESKYLNEKGEVAIINIYNRIRNIPNDSYSIPSLQEYKIVKGITAEGWYQYIPTEPQKGKIYFIRETESENIKVGFSKNPQKRLQGLQSANSNHLCLIDMVDVDNMRASEENVKNQLTQYKIRGEWYSLPDQIELKIGIEKYILYKIRVRYLSGILCDIILRKKVEDWGSITEKE